MNAFLGAIATTYAGLFILAVLAVSIQWINAQFIRWRLGRDLQAAAGSYEDARLAIADAKMCSHLRQKTDERRGFRELHNIVPFRIVNKGKPINFEDDRGAA